MRIRMFGQMQLRLALMSFIQCQEFVIKPEGIDENVIDPPDPLLCSKHIPLSAGRNGGIGTQGMDQVGFVFDVGIYQGVAHAGAEFFMGVAAADLRFMEALCQFGGGAVGLWLFTGVIGFDKIEAGDQIPGFLSASGIHKAQIFFSAGMGRAEDSSEMMDDVNQQAYRKAAEFQNGQFYPCGHDNDNMSRVNGVIFDAFQDDEVAEVFVRALNVFLIMAVCLIRIMIGNEHALISFFAQGVHGFIECDFAVQGAFLRMAVHIQFQKIPSFFVFLVGK